VSPPPPPLLLPLHPAPCTLHPAPCTLRPAPCMLQRCAPGPGRPTLPSRAPSPHPSPHPTPHTPHPTPPPPDTWRASTSPALGWTATRTWRSTCARACTAATRWSAPAGGPQHQGCRPALGGRWNGQSHVRTPAHAPAPR
jgi:hypothetical protein